MKEAIDKFFDEQPYLLLIIAVPLVPFILVISVLESLKNLVVNIWRAYNGQAN